MWLEPLCTDLHRPTEAGPLWWGSVFKGGVKEIGRTLLLLDPWENAPVLRRSWSLYHLHCTLASKDTELEMTMSDEAADRLQQALIDDMTSVENTLDGKSDGGWRKLAEASKPEHKALVERMIEKSPDGGWDGFSDRLLDELSAWLLERAKAALASLSEEERPTSKLLDRVVALLQEHGKVEEAEPLLTEQVRHRDVSRTQGASPHTLAQPTALTFLSTLCRSTAAPKSLARATPRRWTRSTTTHCCCTSLGSSRRPSRTRARSSTPAARCSARATPTRSPRSTRCRSCCPI